MAANMSDEVHKVAIRMLVDKEKNKVVYAEAGNDFVDVLFSFLTLPLGTIARFMAKETDILEAVKVGSLSSLYQSVADLDEQYLWTPACKEMLLKPRNSMEAYCRKLKLNIDDAELLQYFMFECTCPVYKCLTIFENQMSHCGKPMNQVTFPFSFAIENGFVVETATFIISDDLHVMPNDIATNLSLLRMHGNNDIESIEIKTILIGMNEIVDLLKLSLLSKTPLTDFIFKKKQFPGNSNQSEFEIKKVVDSSEEGRKMELKLLLRKSTGEILLAEAKEDFADLLFSFLTFPLGGVLRMLEGFTSLGCIDNLYKSMTELNADSYFTSQELKDKIAMIQIATPFQIRDQILPIGAEPLPDAFKLFDFVDPKSPTGYSCGGYARGQVKYMVTDDLVLTPMLAIDVVSSLQMMKFPLNDLEEKVIPIGVNEALRILKASLTSTSALTNGLNQYITKALLCKKGIQFESTCHALGT